MILRVLTEGDSYGYAISKRISQIAQEGYAIKETTLYSAFGRLEKLQFVRSYPGTVSGGRERIYYSLTPNGWQQFRLKCHEWELLKALIDSFTRGA